MNPRDQHLAVHIHHPRILQQPQAQKAAQKIFPWVGVARFGVFTYFRILLGHQQPNPRQGHLLGRQQCGVAQGELFWSA